MYFLLSKLCYLRYYYQYAKVPNFTFKSFPELIIH